MILTELMDTSLDRFYTKSFELKLKLPEIFFSKIAESVLSALAYMKKLKIMHRDIKPSNILLNSNGDVKLCDFGISGFTNDSICNTFKGCQRYMAVILIIYRFFLIIGLKFLFLFTKPERIKLTGKGYSIKSDIWSLGISLVDLQVEFHIITLFKFYNSFLKRLKFRLVFTHTVK